MLNRIFCVVLIATITQVVNAAEKFTCQGRASGYYADVDTGCQVYHMCEGLGRKFSYKCPNTTLFQQRMLICDHWYMVNCSKAELDYSANLLIGQRDKPFVEDSSEHPYHRTPRPDLLQQPYAPRYQDDEYRQGRAQNLNSAVQNLVGVATDEEDENGNPIRNYTTDRPQYFLPSHWSTQYGKGLTTPIPIPIKNKVQKPSVSLVKNPNSFDSKPVSNNNFNQKPFKGFKEVKPDIEPLIPPPLPTVINNQNNQFALKPIVNNNFNNINNQQQQFTTTRVTNPPTSTFTQPGTTKFVTLPPSTTIQGKDFSNNIPKTFNQPLKVNQEFVNKLNIPDTINEESASPSSVALPPFVPNFSRRTTVGITTVSTTNTPLATDDNQIQNLPEPPSIYYQPPKFVNFRETESTTMDPQTFYKLVPSKDLLPPPIAKSNQVKKLSVPNVSLNLSPSSTTAKNINKKDTEQDESTDRTLTDKRWKELRQMFFIPEYDFPLEVGVRPSYESGLSSFQVNPAPQSPEMRFRERPGSELNPECPKCDPAFVVPGTCKPCVMIRR